MSRRHFTNPHSIISGESMGASITGAWTDVSQYDQILYLASWSGAGVGALTVEISNDKTEVHELNFGETIDIADVATKKHIISIEAIAQKWMRIKYTRSSGTGNLTVSQTMTSKGA